MSKQALGKGFDGLIPTGFDVNTVAEPGENVKQIRIELLQPNPEQPRKSFDEDALQELAQSIKQHGIIQPLVVTPSGENYRIVAGERRFRASKIAGLKIVPCIIRNHKELEELEVALVENVQRVDLSPLETAVSIVKLRDQFSLTPKQISQKLGKAETTISNITRLLHLPKEAVAALQNGSISEGHARAILALKTDEVAQKELMNKIIAQKLSVREAEDFVKQFKKKTTSNNNDKKHDNAIAKVEAAQQVKASIKQKKKGGVLTLSYKDTAQLDKLLELLAKG